MTGEIHFDEYDVLLCDILDVSIEKVIVLLKNIKITLFCCPELKQWKTSLSEYLIKYNEN